jgi:hypothetical protein
MTTALNDGTKWTVKTDGVEVWTSDKLDIPKLLKEARDKIVSSLGIPKELLQGDANYSSAKQDIRKTDNPKTITND